MKKNKEKNMLVISHTYFSNCNSILRDLLVADIIITDVLIWQL